MKKASTKVTKECKLCSCEFISWSCHEKKFCSHKCYWQNVKGKENKRLTESRKGKEPWNKGKKGLQVSWAKGKTNIFSKEALKRIGDAHRGVPGWNKGNKGFLSGEKHYKWIADRKQLKSDRKHAYDVRYREWMKAVKNRDGWLCQISNGDCSGQLEAHHILGWSFNPELRYEINNGITLCRFHHPRKRSEEERLSPYFKELVASSVKPI